jgi:hypothetical protein
MLVCCGFLRDRGWRGAGDLPPLPHVNYGLFAAAPGESPGVAYGKLVGEWVELEIGPQQSPAMHQSFRLEEQEEHQH